MNLLKLALISFSALVFLDYIKKVGDMIFIIDASLNKSKEVLM